MKIIRSIREMQNYSESQRQNKKKVGFVPTMGFLHDGHLSLVDYAREKSDIVVVSIFVNPTQFAPSEDLSKYPRDLDRDTQLLEERGVDALFFPAADEIYPENFQTYVSVEDITQELEGSSRPTHFRGVTTIVSILFNAVKPNYAVFGQKDAQQAAVITRMVKDLNFDIELIIAPIMREADGLAMSSRNIYLSQLERTDALILNKTLLEIEEKIFSGETSVKKITEDAEQKILAVDSANLDYISVVDADTFAETDTIIAGKKYFILMACYIGKTRLIDNLLIST